MNVRFETCNRQSALSFLKKLYPNRDIEDNGIVSEILDLVEQDCFRIPDPDMHGSRVSIFPGKNFDKSKSDEYRDLLMRFHNDDD